MDIAIWLIRLGVALNMVAFGIHQIISPKPWIEEYVPQWVMKMRISPKTIMQIHGGGNLILGLFLVSGFWSQASAVSALVWWVLILPFAFYGSWKAGMRDVAITFALAALVWLTLGGV